MSPGMEDKAVRGVPWTVLSYGANKAITVATTVVLARVLRPADFGLFTLALLAVIGLSLCNDLGLGGVLIVRQDLDRKALGTMLTLMILMAAAVAILLAAVAPLAALAFDEPRLRDILLALSPVVLLGGPNWFYEALLWRELEFRRRFVALTAQSVSYSVTAIVLATVFDAGVWSLVGGQLVGVLIYGVTLFSVAPYHVRPAFERATARMFAGAGVGFLLQRVSGFLQENTDYLVVGRTLGSRSLGYYSMGYRMAELPYWGIADPVGKVTFAGFARMHARGEDVRPSFLPALRHVALVACPLGIVLSAAADPFTRTVFGTNWLPMIAPLTVLGLWGAIRPIQATLGWLLNSLGRSRLLGVLSVGALVILLPFLIVAAKGAGTTGVAWVMFADVVVSLGLLSYFVARHVRVTPSDLRRALQPTVLGCVAAWVVGRAVAGIDAAPPVALALSAVAALGVYGLVVTALAPGLVPDAIRQVGQRLASASSEAPEGS
jgi:O-antigen/teichoic acid export membrane protein